MGKKSNNENNNNNKETPTLISERRAPVREQRRHLPGSHAADAGVENSGPLSTAHIYICTLIFLLLTR